MGKQKYSVEEKLAAVKRVVEGKEGQNEVGRDTGIHHGDILKWVSAYRYHGVEGITRPQMGYTGEFKQMAVEDMRQNRLSQRETAAKYNVAHHGIIAKWERIYLEEGVNGLYEERRGRGRKCDKKTRCLPNNIEEDLIAENQRLRAEVDYLKKLSALVRQREQRERRPK